MLPVEWREGWPFIGRDGGTELSCVIETESPETGGQGYETVASLWTTGWHTFAPSSLDPLSIATVALPMGGPLDHSDPSRPSTALLRFQTEDEQVFSATVRDVVGHGRAGVAVYSSPQHHFVVLAEFKDKATEMTFTRRVDDIISVTHHTLQGEGAVKFTIEATVASYQFYAERGQESVDLGQGSARVHSAEACEWFVGANFALVAEGEAGSFANFHDITQGPARQER